MIKLDFNFNVFITLFVLCIAGIVFSTIAIDQQIDSYIEELKMEVQVINNSNNEIVIDQEDNNIIVNVNPIMEDKQEIETEASKGIVISTTGLNIRQSPTLDSNRVGVLYYGDEVNILEDCGDWYRTEDGFIFKEYVLKI